MTPFQKAVFSENTMRKRRECLCDFQFVVEKDLPAAVFGEDKRLIQIIQFRRVALKDRLDHRVVRKQKY